jgi:dipeptidyl aminopeptidase/acylaminoacyl peptidase
VPVLENVTVTPGTGSVLAAVAPEAGTLVYVPATPPVRDAIVVYNHDGSVQTLQELDGFGAGELTVSPDGQRIAVRGIKANDDIHVYDFTNGTLSRTTFEAGDEQNPVWAPDSQRLAYSAARGQVASIYIRTLDSNEPPRPIVESDKFRVPSSFSPDGTRLAYIEIDDSSREDIWTVPLNDGTPVPFARTSFRERAPTFSPDGRWLAYESDESGTPQIYMAAYPDGSQKRQVSVDGGIEPLWDKAALFYRNGDLIMAVDAGPGANPTLAKPRRVLEASFKGTTSTPGGRRFAPLSGGSRFVAWSSGTRQPIREVRLLLNWFDELQRLVPISR